MTIAAPLRARIAELDARIAAFLAWSDQAWGRGHARLGQACTDYAETLDRQADVLREEAAWLEARWPDEPINQPMGGRS